MIEKQTDVKSKSQVVGQAEYAVYDSVQEAAEHLGVEKALELINAQVRTNAMNEVRGSATGKPSKKKLREAAQVRATPEQWASVAGDSVAIENMLVVIEQTITAELEQQQAATAATAAPVDDGADDDDDD